MRLNLCHDAQVIRNPFASNVERSEGEIRARQDAIEPQERVRVGISISETPAGHAKTVLVAGQRSAKHSTKTREIRVAGDQHRALFPSCSGRRCSDLQRPKAGVALHVTLRIAGKELTGPELMQSPVKSVDVQYATR